MANPLQKITGLNLPPLEPTDLSVFIMDNLFGKGWHNLGGGEGSKAVTMIVHFLQTFNSLLLACLSLMIFYYLFAGTLELLQRQVLEESDLIRHGDRYALPCRILFSLQFLKAYPFS